MRAKLPFDQVSLYINIPNDHVRLNPLTATQERALLRVFSKKCLMISLTIKYYD